MRSDMDAERFRTCAVVGRNRPCDASRQALEVCAALALERLSRRASDVQSIFSIAAGSSVVGWRSGAVHRPLTTRLCALSNRPPTASFSFRVELRIPLDSL